MAYKLTVLHLEEAMKKSGCPICRSGREAGLRAMHSFLWEMLNDPEARQPMIRSRGLCPEHTRQFAAAEISTSGPPVGINIIYEQLTKTVLHELNSYNPNRIRWLAGFWKRLRSFFTPSLAGGWLASHGNCPICDLVASNNLNNLAALMDEIELGGQETINFYQKSDGLCLNHLREAINQFGERHPHAAVLLIDHARVQLKHQQEGMLEFIRKNNWEYKDELLSASEQAAWLKTLSFFTGLPYEKFTFKVDSEDR